MLKDPRSTARAMQRNLASFSVGLPLALVFCVSLWFLSSSLRAQENEQEVVANLAAGRVVLYVARDAIVIGAVEQHVEPDSRPPLVLPLGERRLGILLGAVEWVWPASGRPLVRLDRDLPALLSEATRPQPKPEMAQASDIEVIGVTFLESLRAVTNQLHHKLDLHPDEPVAELLVVGYEPGYGPEVWLLAYRLAQEVLRGEYWRTRVLRPSYTQLYPPEKVSRARCSRFATRRTTRDPLSPTCLSKTTPGSPASAPLTSKWPAPPRGSTAAKATRRPPMMP